MEAEGREEVDREGPQVPGGRVDRVDVELLQHQFAEDEHKVHRRKRAIP